MPKKFLGENSKAAAARARKAEAKVEADAVKKKEEEDALWEETDKHVLKKGQRKVSVPLLWCHCHICDCSEAHNGSKIQSMNRGGKAVTNLTKHLFKLSTFFRRWAL